MGYASNLKLSLDYAEELAAAQSRGTTEEEFVKCFCPEDTADAMEFLPELGELLGNV